MMVAAESRAWISIVALPLSCVVSTESARPICVRADAGLAVDLASVDVDADGIAGEAFLECDVQPWHANFLVTCPDVSLERRSLYHIETTESAREF